MRNFIRGVWKALAGGVYAGASAAGIVIADLDWRAIFGAFVVGVLGVYFSPTNKLPPAEATTEINLDLGE